MHLLLVNKYMLNGVCKVAECACVCEPADEGTNSNIGGVGMSPGLPVLERTVAVFEAEGWIHPPGGGEVGEASVLDLTLLKPKVESFFGDLEGRS